MDEELQHFLSLLAKQDGRYYKVIKVDNPITLNDDTFILYNSKGVDIYRTYGNIAKNCEQVCIQLGIPLKKASFNN